MPASIKIKTLQQRKELKRLINAPSLGRIFRVNKSRTTKELIKKLEKREQDQIAAQKEIQKKAQKGSVDFFSIKNKEVEAFNKKALSGSLNFNEFKRTKIYQDTISKYGGDLGQDASVVTYINYLESFRKKPLSKEEILTRASALQGFQKKMKVKSVQTMLSTPTGRQEFLESQKRVRAFKKEVKALNKMGFVLGERGIVKRSKKQPVNVVRDFLSF